jgi:hypothetical protein
VIEAGVRPSGKSFSGTTLLFVIPSEARNLFFRSRPKLREIPRFARDDKKKLLNAGKRFCLNPKEHQVIQLLSLSCRSGLLCQYDCKDGAPDGV